MEGIRTIIKDYGESLDKLFKSVANELNNSFPTLGESGS